MKLEIFTRDIRSRGSTVKMRIADFAATVLMLSCLVLPTHVQARGDQMMKLENRFVAVELRGFTRRGALVCRKTARGRLRKAPGHGHPNPLRAGGRGRWNLYAVLHGIPTTRRRRTIQKLESIPECRPIENPSDREQRIETEGRRSDLPLQPMVVQLPCGRGHLPLGLFSGEILICQKCFLLWRP